MHPKNLAFLIWSGFILTSPLLAQSPETRGLTPLRSSPKIAPRFGHCTPSEINTLNEALYNSTRLAAFAWLELAVGSPTSNPPYLTWFGAYDAKRYDRVTANFTAIYEALANQEFLFYCADKTEDVCDPPIAVRAFAYPDDAYTVSFCPLYWTLPATGKDSKADTLLDVVSHYTVVAQTFDFCHDAAECMRLAASDPKEAIETSGTYGYFADSVGPTP